VGGYVFLLLLLVIATALAFQNRYVRQEFQESSPLFSVIYAHFLFFLVRILLSIFGRPSVNEDVLACVVSFLLSLDALSTLCIYFLPMILIAIKTNNQDDISSTAVSKRRSCRSNTEERSSLTLPTRRRRLKNQDISSYFHNMFRHHYCAHASSKGNKTLHSTQVTLLFSTFVWGKQKGF